MAKSQKLTINNFGLKTSVGELEADPGYLRVCHNLELLYPGVMEKRAGMKRLHQWLVPGHITPGDGASIYSIVSTKGLGYNLLLNTGDQFGAYNIMYGDGVTAAWERLYPPDAGDVTNTESARMKSAVSLNNIFLTSSRHPVRVESDVTTLAVGTKHNAVTWAGMPRIPGFDWGMQGATNLQAVPPFWLQDGYSVAYRVVFGTYDADGNERLSAPSGRWVLSNSSQTPGYVPATAQCPLVLVKIPYQTDTLGTPVDTNWFFRLFRTTQVPNATANPSDEMQLCYEYKLTSTDITNGFVQVIDRTPDAALTTALYTNLLLGGDVSSGVTVSGSTGLGLVSQNDRPPIAEDVALYADCLVWANIKGPQRLTLSILGVQAAAGGPLFSVGDTISIQGMVTTLTYTGVAGAPAGPSQFTVETGYASQALNIRKTVMNLVSSINANYGSSGVIATYIGSDASPGTIGQFMLESVQQEWTGPTGPNGGILVTTNRVTAFTPTPEAYLESYKWESARDVFPNGIAISKPLQGDAVPPVNYLRVGRSDTVIRRVVPISNALFIFCDDGIYWMRGTAPTNFIIERFDPTVRILARETCVALGDSVFVWAKEGIFRVSAGGSQRIDQDIRNQVESIRYQADTDQFTQYFFAYAHPIKNVVTFCWTYDDAAAHHGAFRGFTFHLNTALWSSRDVGWIDPLNPAVGPQNVKSCAAVRFIDDSLFMGQWECDVNGWIGIIFSDYGYQGPGIHGVNAVFEDSPNNTAGALPNPVTATMEWVTSVPNPGGICHWSEFQAYSSVGSIMTNAAWGVNDLADLIFESYPIVDSYLVQITSELGAVTQATLLPTSNQGRLYLATESGYSSRQIVRLIHSTNAAGSPSYCQFTGFSFLYRAVSGRNTR